MFYRLTVLLLSVVICIISAGASVYSWVQTSLDTPMSIDKGGYVLQVPEGSTLSHLARQLTSEGLIANPYPLLIFVRMEGTPQIIKVGEYAISSRETPRQMLARLVAGDVIRYRITFPEGRSLDNWLDTINGVDKLLQRGPVDKASLLKAVQPPAGDELEGWFFPETYSFTTFDTGLDILVQAHRAMKETLEKEWADRRTGLPLKTPYEALILASIVEMETGHPEERAAIAGVFVRRLQNKMKLQTDPTVIYGLKERFAGNLTRQHLMEENPYNTYRVHGLPPTPICNPGREAIHAVLHPLEGDELYFVARGDGSHQFSRTLAEHLKAVKTYQLNRVENYRSSPR